MSLPWLRLYHRIIDNDKMRLLAFEDRWHFIAVLCMKRSGLLDDPEGDLKTRKIAVKMGLQTREVEEVFRRLCDVGLTDRQGNPIGLSGICAFTANDSRPSAHDWRLIRERIFSRDGFTCTYCGARGVRLECDHIHPVALGGTHNEENLTTACRACNRAKRSKTKAQWEACREVV